MLAIGQLVEDDCFDYLQRVVVLDLDDLARGIVGEDHSGKVTMELMDRSTSGSIVGNFYRVEVDFGFVEVQLGSIEE